MKKYGYKLLTLLLLAVLLLSGCAGNGKEEETTLPPVAGQTADIRFVVDNELYALFSVGGVPTAPAKQGFRFDGWYRDKGTWEQPADVSAWSEKTLSEVFALLSYTENADLSLFARFVEMPSDGYLPGALCPSYDVSLFAGEGSADTFNVSGAGKVTVINFWGTWCGPCKSELPHFDELAREYGDRIVMLAIHSNQGVADAPAYIAEHYADSPILFGYDNARCKTPMVDILDFRGGDAFNVVLDKAKVTLAPNAKLEAELKALIESALENGSQD